MGDNTRVLPRSHTPALPKWASALLVFYLVVSAAYIGQRGLEKAVDSWRVKSIDLRVFYAAGAIIVSDERGYLYDLPHNQDVRGEHRWAVGNFFSPPLLALLYTPMSLLSFQAAKGVSIALSVAATAVILVTCATWSRRRAHLALAALATVSFWPAYTAVLIGQPILIFAALMGLAVMAYAKERYILCGFLTGLIGLKPSLVMAQAGYIFFRGNRTAVVAAVASLAVLLMTPFLFLGFDSIHHYQRLLSASRNDAFTFSGYVSGGANYMFNWNGFWARLLVADPKPLLVFPFYLATALLMIKVWLGGRLVESWLAVALATCLAIPHFAYYDLPLLLPAALALAVARPEPRVIAVLALAHLCINLSVWQVWQNRFFFLVKDDFMLILATPALFLLLAFLAFESEIQTWWEARGKAGRGTGYVEGVEATS